ncbi:hypothetical protein [Mycobacterium phage SWU1]|uniref:Gene 66 protein n=2 Tax=Fromanvirus TaxID=186764 RepID=VG66_BPML5|nr:phosphoesterase [Fromanvirus L5]YP_006382989.1 phosphoesterase [Mycobacterium phage SWU1]Q05280.1 RecName: Full=Gene 66 protein; AltName: Full=Gp66 [Fromanvirus L5]AFI24979.1 hypothetical protein [Mycobacterium phage SWU1]CAA79442.1 Phosphoesterase [Fromanvirus L5]
MSNTWFTSDLHIGHKRLMEIRNLADDVEEHDATLAKAWDSVVGKDDTVWILGDISSGSTKGQIHALGWISDRPGRKRLILGNHDGPHPMNRDAHKLVGAYWMVFEHVSTAARIRVPLYGDAGGHTDVLLSHFPYVGDHTSEDRHTQWRLRDDGKILIHGHTHSPMILSRHIHRRQIHVGIDAWGRLVSRDEIYDLVNHIHEEEGVHT